MKITRLETLDDPLLDPYARLTDVQLRSRLEPRNAVFIAESAEVIDRALDGGMHPLSLLTAERFLPQVSAVVEKLQRANPVAPVFVAPESELQRLTGFGNCSGRAGFQPDSLEADDSVFSTDHSNFKHTDHAAFPG